MERPERNTEDNLNTDGKREVEEFPFRQCGAWAWGSFAANLVTNAALASHPASRIFTNILFLDMGAVTTFLSGMIAGADTPQWVRNGCTATILSGMIGMVCGIASLF